MMSQGNQSGRRALDIGHLVTNLFVTAP